MNTLLCVCGWSRTQHCVIWVPGKKGGGRKRAKQKSKCFKKFLEGEQKCSSKKERERNETTACEWTGGSWVSLGQKKMASFSATVLWWTGMKAHRWTGPLTDGQQWCIIFSVQSEWALAWLDEMLRWWKPMMVTELTGVCVCGGQSVSLSWCRGDDGGILGNDDDDVDL